MCFYFGGAKLVMYFSQDPHTRLSLLTSKLAHVLRLSSLSQAVFRLLDWSESHHVS